MPRLRQPSPKQEREWSEWVATRPDAVRATAERIDPWSLYCLKSTRRRVLLSGIAEDGTVCGDITGDCPSGERAVRGIDPADLELCDIPSPIDPARVLTGDAEIAANIHALRVMLRPDLYEMGPDGISRRREATDEAERKRA